MHAQDEREGLALVRGPLMRQSVITAAWAANGWHGYRRGGSETAVPYPGQLVYNLSRCAASLPRKQLLLRVRAWPSLPAPGKPRRAPLKKQFTWVHVSNRVAACGGVLRAWSAHTAA